MAVQEIIEQAEQGLTAKRVFGEPYEHDGLTIIPAAKVAGGGGGSEAPGEKGTGGGFGGLTVPSGAYVIEGGKVTWKPAVDVNRIVLGTQVLVGIAILTAGAIVKARARRRVDLKPVLKTVEKVVALRRLRRR